MKSVRNTFIIWPLLLCNVCADFRTATARTHTHTEREKKSTLKAVNQQIERGKQFLGTLSNCVSTKLVYIYKYVYNALQIFSWHVQVIYFHFLSRHCRCRWHTHTNVTRTSSGCALNYRARNLMHAFLIAFSHYILLAGIWVFYYFI